MRHLLGSVALAAVLAAGAARAADRPVIDEAVERGVNALRASQRADGSWPAAYGMSPTITGPTALAGLTFLECGVDKGDRAVVRAADYVRAQCPTLGYTYAISLSILFLDRLGDPGDVPLIQSLAARLSAGQLENGAWTYFCPAPNPTEQQRLRELVSRRGVSVDLRTAGAGESEGDTPREEGDMPRGRREGRFQNRPGPHRRATGQGDNSNTQFATLALWVARRHGTAVDRSLLRVLARFRSTQNQDDGGWPYQDVGGRETRSTPTMTCAGLLALAVGYGVELDSGRGAGKPAHELAKDGRLKAGLHYLARSVGAPSGLPAGAPVLPDGGPMKNATERTYYFLWSVERVAVALNLDTIGKKDWYSWGANILLTTQRQDGHWSGGTYTVPADTCFALLFLKRANLATDLSKLTGRVPDPGVALLKSGGIGGSGLTGRGTAPDAPAQEKAVPEKPAPEAQAHSTREAPARSPPDGPPPAESAKTTPPPPEPAKAAAPADNPGARLAALLLSLPAERQAAEIERVRDQKGPENTEALAAAAPLLPAETRRRVRDALSDRLARMTPKTLGNYLSDDDAEIRAAAALACAKRNLRQLVPGLIDLLNDREVYVVRAAREALKYITEQDFGPEPGVDAAARKDAAAKWREWWQTQTN